MRAERGSPFSALELPVLRRHPQEPDPVVTIEDIRKPRIAMPDLTPEGRIATSMEDISRYLDEIRQLLQELSARPDVDNEQLARIATATVEIQRIIPALLLR